LFSRGFEEAQFQAKQMTIPFTHPMIRPCLNDATKKLVNALNEDALRREAARISVPSDSPPTSKPADSIFRPCGSYPPETSKSLFTTERVDKGPARGVRDGVAFTLNGECACNLDIYISKNPSKGLILPAGFANGKCLILMAVKENRNDN
jgi:hypothetical protein